MQGPSGQLEGEEPLDDLDGRLRALELGNGPARAAESPGHAVEIQNGL